MWAFRSSPQFSVNVFNCLLTEMLLVALKWSHSCWNTVESEFTSGIWTLSINTISRHCGVHKKVQYFQLDYYSVWLGETISSIAKLQEQLFDDFICKRVDTWGGNSEEQYNINNWRVSYCGADNPCDHVLLPVFDKIFYHFCFNSLPVP